MAGGTTWTSNLGALERGDLRAVDAGLVAAAQVLLNAVRQKLRGGYTSGAFFRGVAMNSVTRSEPYWDAGARAIAVGTNLLYPLFWELGHHNIYTRRYERQERWRPAMLESADAINAAFARVYRRTLDEALARARPTTTEA